MGVWWKPCIVIDEAKNMSSVSDYLGVWKRLGLSVDPCKPYEHDDCAVYRLRNGDATDADRERLRVALEAAGLRLYFRSDCKPGTDWRIYLEAIEHPLGVGGRRAMKRYRAAVRRARGIRGEHFPWLRHAMRHHRSERARINRFGLDLDEAQRRRGEAVLP